MDTFKTVMLAFARIFIEVSVIFIVATSIATADDHEEMCQLSNINSSFMGELPEDEDARKTYIRNIQQKLLQGQFGKHTEKKFSDGLWGAKTKLALQNLCLYFKVEESTDTLAPRLIELLEISAGESKNYPALVPQMEEAEDILPRYHQIQVSGGGCGCSEDYSALVYGFYPYWSAQGEEQIIDFSLFDRIGFYALRVGNDGMIADSLQWSNDWYIADFINQVHRYKVELDAVFYLTGWHDWNEDQIIEASKNIVSSATQRFDSRSPEDWSGRIDRWVRDQSSTQADGINLYFDDFTEITHGANIVRVIREVSEQLRSNASQMQLSITLDLPFDASNKSRQQKLIEALKDDTHIFLDKKPAEEKQSWFRHIKGEHESTPTYQDTDEDLVENVFVFLSRENSSRDKKELRSSIEETFSGLNRKRVLRKIVPVIATGSAKKDKSDKGVSHWTEAIDKPTKHSPTPFVDDLIYLEDNFGGVGLWPLPLAVESEENEIKLKLDRLFGTDVTSNQFLGNFIDDHIPELCQFVCPNRWYFRLILDLLVGIIITFWVISRFHCRLRDFYHDHHRYFLILFAVTTLVILATLTCDPSWKQRANNVVSIFIAVIVATYLFGYIRKSNQPPLP